MKSYWNVQVALHLIIKKKNYEKELWWLTDRPVKVKRSTWYMGPKQSEGTRMWVF